jgi:hypothetical protein
MVRGRASVKTKNAWRVTWIYLLCIVFYFCWFYILNFDSLVIISPNELGDTLAGIFAPLAFFWLVFGYYQQGEELKQNTEALKLQAVELENLVMEQKKLIQLSEDERIAKHFSVKPLLVVDVLDTISMEGGVFIDENTGNKEDTREMGFKVKIKNLGNTAKDITLLNDNVIVKCWYEIKKNSENTYFFLLNSKNGGIVNETEDLEKSHLLETSYQVKYHDIYGKEYLIYFKTNFKKNEKSNYYEVTLQTLST